MYMISSRPLYQGLFIAILCYSLFALSLEELVEPIVGVALLIVLVALWSKKRPVFISVPFVFIFFAIAIGLFSWVLMRAQHPDIADSSPRIENLTNKFLFVPLALVLLGCRAKTLLFWAALGLGALLTPWLSGGGLAEIQYALAGHRSGFGLHPITMGMIYAVCFMVIVIFYQRFCSGRDRVVKSALMLALALVFLFGVLASQTRAIYLAFLVILSFTFLGVIFFAFKYRERCRNYLIAFLLFLIVAVLFVALFYSLGFFDGLLDKVASELTIIEPLLRGDFSHVPRNSAGLRIHFWVDAWQMGMERFWMGWGEGGNHYLHEKAGNFFGQRHFVTVHNDWLELFLAYGVWGVLLYASVLYWISRQIFLLWRDKLLATDFFVFYLVFIVFFLVNGLFMSVLYFKESLLLWNVIMAGYLGFIFRCRYFSEDEVRCLCCRMSCH